jgi:hypothetical protein
MRSLCTFTVLLVGAWLYAKEPPPPTPPVVRAAEAHLVVVGEVTEVQKLPVAVVQPNGQGGETTVSYTLAEVAVKTLLTGPEGKKTVTVGFHPRKEPSKEDGYTLQLAAKEVRCLFLKRHPTEGFYVESGVGEPLDPAKKADQPALEQVKRVAAVLADPVKALKAEKADDRVFAALCLAYNYGPPDKLNLTAEDVPKEESDLILKALREADPKKLEREDGLFWVAAVERLGLAKDERLPGWWGERGKDRSAKRFQKYADWYDKPGEKVRLQYWVPK